MSYHNPEFSLNNSERMQEDLRKWERSLEFVKVNGLSHLSPKERQSLQEDVDNRLSEVRLMLDGDELNTEMFEILKSNIEPLLARIQREAELDAEQSI